jgi:hypothetical protein
MSRFGERGQMKIQDKVTTVAFWLLACTVAVLMAGDAFRQAFTADRPWMFVAGLVLCVAAALGARECRRAIRKPRE